MDYKEKRYINKIYKSMYKDLPPPSIDDITNNDKLTNFNFLDPFFFSLRHKIINTNNYNTDTLVYKIRIDILEYFKDIIVIRDISINTTKDFEIYFKTDKHTIKQVLEDMILNLNFDDKTKDDIIYIIYKSY
jgi:hypothetical protein